MEKYTLCRSPKCSWVRRILLIVLLMIAAAIAFLQAVWVFGRIQVGIGAEVAEATMAFDVVLTLVLIMAGFATGYGIDRLIRRRQAFFCSAEKGGWAERFLHVWGYELQYQEESPQTIVETIEVPAQAESALTPIHAPRRRGRKPTFTLEHWLPIAMQWENRDTIRDGFTLGELIAEHLGTNADGSPVVTEQAYYSTWRDRALEELQRRAQSRKTKADAQAQGKA